MKDELILAFDRETIESIYPVGISDAVVTGENYEAIDAATMILPRYMAENSKTTRHPIPYTALYKPSTKQIYVYRRGKGVGEQRLTGNASVGFGGHVDITPETLKEAMTTHCYELTHDMSSQDVNESVVTGVFNPHTAILHCAEREIFEETGVMLNRNQTSNLGVLRDDSDEVGMAHLGWLSVKIIRDDQEIQTAEAELDDVGWMTLSEIDVECPQLKLESWSKILIKYMQEGNGITK